MSRVFVSADYSQMESWLTAWHANDGIMLEELRAQLTGGPKIHARNAALLFKIDPQDAKDRMVPFQGRMITAYDAGKRVSHAFNYRMGAPHMSKLYWIPLSEAQGHIEKLSGKYCTTVRFMDSLADEVFGVFRYECPRCGRESSERVACMECTIPGKRKTIRPLMRYAGVVREPERVWYTRFGRRRFYLSRRRNGQAALASQPAQSSGGSVWTRTLLRLHGYDPYDPEQAWPTPPGACLWSPRLDTYGAIYAPFPVFVATGTYDSFLIECEVSQADRIAQWLVDTMEQPWAELHGLRLPAEVSVGGNWKKWSRETNPQGLRELERTPPWAREAA